MGETTAEQRVGPVSAAFGLLGLVVTGIGLWFAVRHADTTAKELLAGLAIGAGTLAVAAAVLAALLALGARQAFGSVLAAGMLGVCGLALVAAAGVTTLVDEPGAPDGPTVTAQIAEEAGVQVLTVRVTVPDLDSGTVMDARLTGVDFEGAQSTLARSQTPAGSNGVATAKLVVQPSNQKNVMLELRLPDRRCDQTFPLEYEDTTVSVLKCRSI